MKRLIFIVHVDLSSYTHSIRCVVTNRVCERAILVNLQACAASSDSSVEPQLKTPIRHCALCNTEAPMETELGATIAWESCLVTQGSP